MFRRFSACQVRDCRGPLGLARTSFTRFLQSKIKVQSPPFCFAKTKQRGFHNFDFYILIFDR
jgi:hypothetical protein